jgi:hypothetical protein
MAYITHHQRPVAVRLNIARVAALIFNVVLWAGVVAFVERCMALGRV